MNKTTASGNYKYLAVINWPFKVVCEDSFEFHCLSSEIERFFFIKQVLAALWRVEEFMSIFRIVCFLGLFFLSLISVENDTPKVITFVIPSITF